MTSGSYCLERKCIPEQAARIGPWFRLVVEIVAAEIEVAIVLAMTMVQEMSPHGHRDETDGRRPF